MKLLTYAINKKELTGVLNREGTFVYPLSAAGMEYRTMKEVIRRSGRRSWSSWIIFPVFLPMRYPTPRLWRT